MRFTVLTLFPQLIHAYAQETILGRAQDGGHIEVRAIDIRDFATDKHNTVDDTPYGGGAGMLMKAEPIYRAMEAHGYLPEQRKNKSIFVCAMTPRGERFSQQSAERYSSYDEIVFLCGRYEGIDQRVLDHLIDQEVSIGPYVLAGGELPALTIIEATARLIPGVLGNIESAKEESFGVAPSGEVIDGEYPQYTKPRTFMGWDVPDVLLSGNHAQIAKWRSEQATKNKNNDS
jgi:tRNA (guanine37-N1)-methyltransferase